MSAVAGAPQPLGGLVALPVADVRPSPNNPREHLEDIDGLALSIREAGLIQPVIVQQIPGQRGFQLVAGHRRHAAVRKLGWPKIPAIIRRDMLPDEELLAMLVENGQRASLDPIEEARALKRLELQGLTHAEIGQKIGRSNGYVGSRLMLLTLPPAEQEELRAGHYTVTYATDLVRDRRQAERQAHNPVARPIGRPKGAKTRPHFGDTHPLAKAARARCGHRRGTPMVGGVACGPCWEQNHPRLRAGTPGGRGVSTSIDALRVRRVLGRDAWMPPEPHGPDGWTFVARHQPSSVIVSCAAYQGAEWLHASIAHQDHMPTYEDLVLLHRAVFGDGYAFQVFAPPSKHVNIHQHALHLWGRRDGSNLLPDFGAQGTI
jgi:ParB family chromosome partitioning protein